MTEEAVTLQPAPWWEETPAGRTIALAFVKIDRVGTTWEWSELPPDQVDRRYARYTAGVESVARAMKAAQPLQWQGDGVMLFLADDGDESAPLRGFRAARLLWERVAVDLGLPARIAVHAAHIPWSHEIGKLHHPAIDRSGHLEEAAPENAVAVSEDVYLALAEAERRGLAPLGFTTRDGVPAWVFPAAAAERKRADAFRESRDLCLWEKFREYAQGSEIRRLRYVGFPLAKKEPPALEIEEVFVPLEVEIRRRRLAFRPEIEGKAAKRRPGLEREEEEAGLRAPPFAREDQEEPGPPEPFAGVFRDNRRIVVLGDPGSGKTTLLRWLAVVTAGGPFKTFGKLGIAERLLPLPVSVGTLADIRRELGSTCSAPDALARYFHGRHVGEEGELRTFLARALEAGDVLVLLDGLDEVRSSERDEIRAWLETFAARYPRNRFVVTSRHVGFAGFDLGDGVLTSLELFTDEQVRRYVEAFVRAYRRWEMRWTDPVAEVREATQLLEAIQQNPRLAALARNPFMLSALSLIHRAEGRLPRHRVQFYAIFARALCETWGHARRIVAKAPERVVAFEEEAIPVLGELALAMHGEYPAGVAPEEFVLRTLAQALIERRGIARGEAEAVAREFLRRSGDETQILLERGPGRWGFLHLTFQEFFAAAGLHAADRFEQEVMRHLYDPRWEEVLRLGVGYLALVQNRPEAARRFVDRVLKHREKGIRAPLNILPRKHEALAALLAAEAGDALPRDLQREIARVFARWALDIPEEVSRRIEAEIGLTDFRELVLPFLLEALNDKQGWIRARAAQALGTLRGDPAVPALLGALKDTDPNVRACVAEALVALRAEAGVPGLLEALKDSDLLVRVRTVQALAVLRRDVGVPALLENLKDKLFVIRALAAQALGTLRAEAAVPALLDALKDTKLWVRELAAQALGTLRAEAAVPALLDALKDKDWPVRAGAAQALGTLRAEAAVPALLDALKDTDPAVRVLAAQALGTLRAEAALPALLDALKETKPWVRELAAQALGALRAEAAVPALLKALRDKERGVRGRATEALGALLAEAAVPALLALLKNTDPWVRAEAGQALGALGAEAAIGPLVESANRWNGENPERVAAIKSLLQIAESPRLAARSRRRSLSRSRPGRPRASKRLARRPASHRR